MILFVFMFFFYYFVQTHFLLQVRLIGLRPLEWIQHNGIQIQPLNSWTDIDVHNYGGSRRIYSSFIGHIRDSFRHFSLQTNDWQLPLAVKCKIHLRLNSAFTQRWRLKCICNFFFFKGLLILTVPVHFPTSHSLGKCTFVLLKPLSFDSLDDVKDKRMRQW